LKVVKITENHGKMVEILQRIFPRFGFGNFQIFFKKLKIFRKFIKNADFFRKKCKICRKFEKTKKFFEKVVKLSENYKK